MVLVVVVVVAVVGVDVLVEVTSSTGADEEEDFRLRPFFLENINDSNGDNLPVWYACGNTYTLTNDKTVIIHFIRNVCDIIGIDMDMYNKPQTITATKLETRSCCGSCDKFGLYPIATVAKIIFHNPATIQNVDHENGGIDDSIIIVVVTNNGGVMLYHTPNHVILTASTFHFVGGSSSSSISVSTLL